MLHIIPIEPLEERYSAQWLEWSEEYVKEFQKNNTNFQYRIINPPAYEKISTGSFLDVIGTNIYKNAQMQEILKYIDANDKESQNNDVYWFHDLWFPGLEQLAYIRNALDLKFKIYGMLHAGTYDPHDFLTKCGMGKWGKLLENSWFAFIDGIFLATSYHKYLLGTSREINAKKVHVTGFPIRDVVVNRIHSWKERHDTIVFPHRMDAEKQPELCDEMMDELREDNMGRCLRLVKTKVFCDSKREYYNILGFSKFAVSFALQETWGIAMVEATLAGCVPIVPDRLSYFEMYPEKFKYQTTNYEATRYSAAGTIINILKSDRTEIWELMRALREKFLTRGAQAFPKMFKIMYPKLVRQWPGAKV